MPKPRKDFGLAFRKEIIRQDERIAKEIGRRAKLVEAYVVITGDEDSFQTLLLNVPPIDPARRSKSPYQE